MTEQEIASLVAALAPVIKGHVDAAVVPLQRQISAVEARAPEKGEPGPKGEDGPNEASVAAMVAKAVAALPPAPAGKDGEAGQNGKDADPDAIAAQVMDRVTEALKAIPAPKDGKDGRDGADGVGMANAMIDRDYNLVVTMTDGTAKNLGVVVGKDGDRGQDGRDGADGLGFEDMDETLDEDGRTIVRRYQRGDVVKEFRHKFSVVLDRGVFKEGAEYKSGDAVTWGGSMWIAQRDTVAKPDSPDSGWRLGIKRGRDGKDGVLKTPREPGPVRVT